MKRLLLSMLVGFAALSLSAADLEWHTDLAKAQAKAKAENKRVLIDFTGSDWCVFCIKLHKEVFTTPEFAAYAKKNLVLVEIDFPHKTPQSAELKRVNEKLQKEYKVRGFPTVVVLDSAGKKLGEMVGYGGGGPKAVIGKLDGFKS